MRPRALLAAGMCALLAVLAVPGVTAVAAASPPGPALSGGVTAPVYSYQRAIRETVWVSTPTDSDADGMADRVAVDLVRPRETAESGRRVPVIMEASPYYRCCGRGNESERKAYDSDGNISRVPLYYDNYFVPRGYAFAAVDLSGTARSTGCEDVGGTAEVAGARAVVDWLNGRATAFRADGSPVTADWSTGQVGMIGKSWDGSIANGVAATGVEGLATIVPIAAISSWYGYMRFNGVLRASDYPGFLHSYVNGRPAAACAGTLARLRSDSAESTGDYNGFWRERDYRVSVDRVRASVFVVHGVNDLNVPTEQFASWWDGLAERGVPRKLWLHQTGHEDPFDVRRAEWVRTLHRWFDRWLYGVSNGIDREPRATIETAPGTWTEQRDWPVPGAHDVRLSLGAGNGTTGTLNRAGAPTGGVRSYTDQALGESDLVSDPTTDRPGRSVFLSGPLGADLTISGSPSVRLRIRVDRPTTELTARLVDYGVATRIDHGMSEGVRTLSTESCWGEDTAADDACYRDTEEITVTADHAVLTRGWLDAAHHRSLWFTEALLPGRWYDVTIRLDAYQAVVPAGHVLGLVLGQSDPDFTNVDDRDAVVDVDLAGSSVVLPAVGPVGVPTASVAPPVRTDARPGVTAPAPATTHRIPR